MSMITATVDSVDMSYTTPAMAEVRDRWLRQVFIRPFTYANLLDHPAQRNKTFDIRLCQLPCWGRCSIWA